MVTLINGQYTSTKKLLLTFVNYDGHKGTLQLILDNLPQIANMLEKDEYVKYYWCSDIEDQYLLFNPKKNFNFKGNYIKCIDRLFYVLRIQEAVKYQPYRCPLKDVFTHFA